MTTELPKPPVDDPAPGLGGSSVATIDALNAIRGGFDKMIGLRFVSASYDEVVERAAGCIGLLSMLPEY